MGDERAPHSLDNELSGNSWSKSPLGNETSLLSSELEDSTLTYWLNMSLNECSNCWTNIFAALISVCGDERMTGPKSGTGVNHTRLLFNMIGKDKESQKGQSNLTRKKKIRNRQSSAANDSLRQETSVCSVM